MAKCFRCGKSTALRGAVQLKDEVICGKCAKDLGMDKTEILIATQYKYADIKDGMDLYYKKQTIKRSMLEAIEEGKAGLKLANYGQERDLNCTDGELLIYDAVIKALSDAGLDTSCMKLTRKSNDYVSACMQSSDEGYGLMDVARFKFTDRAKWIKTGPSFAKTKIEAPEDVLDRAEEMVEEYKRNEPYL